MQVSPRQRCCEGGGGLSARRTMEWFRSRLVCKGRSVAGDSVIEGERLTREKRM